MLCQALCIIVKPLVNSNWSYSPEMLEIWWMTLKNNRAPVLCYFKLCESFHSHQSYQTGVTDQKHPIWDKIGDILSCVTVKFDAWPWETIGHLFYATSSFVQHFIAISEFKLELWSGKAWIGSKFALTSVTLTFDLGPWPFAWKSILSMVFSWWYDERNIVKRVWQTDRWMDGKDHS